MDPKLVYLAQLEFSGFGNYFNFCEILALSNITIFTLP